MNIKRYVTSTLTVAAKISPETAVSSSDSVVMAISAASMMFPAPFWNVVAVAVLLTPDSVVTVLGSVVSTSQLWSKLLATVITTSALAAP